MADVGQFTMAVNAGRVGLEHANVVQHGSLDGKFFVDGHSCGYEAFTQLCREASNLPAMGHEQLVGVAARGVVSLYDGVIINHARVVYSMIVTQP